ncbi:hypothetical protein UP15_06920 [Bacillus pumilus]|uniref:hypothetical protein n=1 Tax=Bacillus altitudinis TaxID=293387 RepID=UPI00077668A8|nr:hypothetical protein [Bacillus altitudinis]AMM88698.1 hypothetical protein UP15_06920 [Bacillus pumilus]MBR0581002.1 hypothetical protein [Bacillus altitudinis A23-8]PYH27209.1 hypothetical protein US8_01990 [Bacillus altitudinis]
MLLTRKDIILISNIIFLILVDLLILFAILDVLFEDLVTIWAGIIAFAGAIIGGAITYLGVYIQIKHREKELFMETANEKLVKINILINSLKPMLNKFYFIRTTETDEEKKAVNSRYCVNEFDRILTQHKEIVQKYLPYNLVGQIEFYQRSLSLEGEILNINEIEKDVEHLEEIYNEIKIEMYKIEKKYKQLNKIGI